MATDYNDLDLDDILEIASADYNNTWQIQQQASSISELVSALGDCVSGSRDAHDYIEGNITMAGDRPPVATTGNPLQDIIARSVDTLLGMIESASTNAASNQLKLLVDNGATNLTALKPQSDAFDRIATEVGEVHAELTNWKQQRDQDIALAQQDPEDPDLVATYDITDPAKAVTTIRNFHNKKARTRMQKSATYYSDVISQLDVPVPYDGPRIPSPNLPGSSDDPAGNGVHTQPGPPLSRDVAPPPHVTTPPPPPGVNPPDINVPEGPDLQGPGVGAPVPGPALPATPPVGSVPPPSTGVVPPGVFVPTRPVTPPVIGNRPPGIGPRSAFTPNRSGLTRPVIGGRPGANSAGIPRGMQGGRGAMPGARGGMPGGRGAMPGARGGMPGARGGMPGSRGGAPAGRGAVPPGGRGATGTTRSGTPAPRPFAKAANPGTRAKPTAALKTGPVQGRNPKRSAVRQTPTRASRIPKVHHGGNDPNRPVIGRRGAKKTKQSEEQLIGRKPEELVENEWFDVSDTVSPVIGRERGARDNDHDPGDFVTRHNLGRRNWTV